MTDITKRQVCIMYIREYKNFPFEISDEEILIKYGPIIEYMSENFESVLSGNTGNIASIKEDNSQITYSTSASNISSCLPPLLQKILGNPYINQW